MLEYLPEIAIGEGVARVAPEPPRKGGRQERSVAAEGPIAAPETSIYLWGKMPQIPCYTDSA